MRVGPEDSDIFFFCQGGEIQTRVGLLLLLCSWLSSCPLAVAHFLHNSANIPYVSFAINIRSRASLRLSTSMFFEF